MTRASIFDRLLASLYDAMLDDTRWPAASALFDEACGSKGNIIVSGDGDTSPEVDIFFARFCYRGERREDLERLYFETYHQMDERLPRIRQLPDKKVVHVNSLFTDEEKKISPVYNEALPLAQVRNSLNVRLDGPCGSRIVWVVADPVDDDGWSSARVQKIKRFLPHLRQFARVRQALVDSRAHGAAFASLLENTGCGVIQLDRRGRIVAANDRSRALLGAANGLTDEDAVLRAVLPGEDNVLQRLLAQALPRFTGESVSGSTTVSLGGGPARLAVHITPVHSARAAEHDDRVAALVLTTEPGRPLRFDAALVADALKLTEVEANLALLLAEGHTLREIAERTGRSYDTLRWHLKNIFIKQGVKHQTELVRRVLSLSLLAGVRR